MPEAWSFAFNPSASVTLTMLPLRRFQASWDTVFSFFSRGLGGFWFGAGGRFDGCPRSLEPALPPKADRLGSISDLGLNSGLGLRACSKEVFHTPLLLLLSLLLLLVDYNNQCWSLLGVPALLWAFGLPGLIDKIEFRYVWVALQNKDAGLLAQHAAAAAAAPMP